MLGYALKPYAVEEEKEEEEEEEEETFVFFNLHIFSFFSCTQNFVQVTF